MDRCRPLAEYALLVDKVREYQASGMEFADAIVAAVTWCIKNDCMVEYLRKHREEKQTITWEKSTKKLSW